VGEKAELDVHFLFLCGGKHGLSLKKHGIPPRL
jgi:hypothetical protein